jgi:hypothetical protein
LSMLSSSRLRLSSRGALSSLVYDCPMWLSMGLVVLSRCG